MLHPLVQRAQTFPPTSDTRAMAQRLAEAFEQQLNIIRNLAPNEPGAEDALVAASELLGTISNFYGPIHGVTLQARRAIYDEAQRLLGPQQDRVSPPEWTEP